MIGILISANVQNLCLNDCISSSSDFPVPCGSAPIQRGELHLPKARVEMIPSVEFSDFPLAQLVEFFSDLWAPMDVMLKLVIWLFQNQIPCYFARCLHLKELLGNILNSFNSLVLVGLSKMAKVPLRKYCCRWSF